MSAISLVESGSATAAVAKTKLPNEKTNTVRTTLEEQNVRQSFFTSGNKTCAQIAKLRLCLSRLACEIIRGTNLSGLCSEDCAQPLTFWNVAHARPDKGGRDN